jgi:hypothetical protein
LPFQTGTNVTIALSLVASAKEKGAAINPAQRQWKRVRTLRRTLEAIGLTTCEDQKPLLIKGIKRAADLESHEADKP